MAPTFEDLHYFSGSQQISDYTFIGSFFFLFRVLPGVIIVDRRDRSLITVNKSLANNSRQVLEGSVEGEDNLKDVNRMLHRWSSCHNVIISKPHLSGQ